MNIFERVYRILLRPSAEWKIIDEERADLSYLLNIYIAALAAIPAVSGLIGFSAIGVEVPDVGTVRVPVFSGLLGAVFGYLFAFVAVYGLAALIYLLASRFGASKSFPAALKLAVYSNTPVWVTGIFLLAPGLWFLTVLGFYGFYLLWSGLPILMKAPQERSFLYAAIVIGGAFVLRILIGWCESALFSLPQVI
jgi:Yip1 domain